MCQSFETRVVESRSAEEVRSSMCMCMCMCMYFTEYRRTVTPAASSEGEHPLRSYVGRDARRSSFPEDAPRRTDTAVAIACVKGLLHTWFGKDCSL